MDFCNLKLCFLDPIFRKKASSMDLLLHLGTGGNKFLPAKIGKRYGLGGSELNRTEYGDSCIDEKSLQTMLVECCSMTRIELPGCVAVNDQLFYNLCHVQALQQNLRNLNIYGTSVSPAMATNIFYALPRLETFVYHDLSGFLHYAHVNNNTTAKKCVTKRVCKLQLGMVHNASIHLTFSNCDNGDIKDCQELELYLPASKSESIKNDIFQFKQDKHGMFEFEDIYRVIIGVKPEKIFGGSATAYPLTEMSCFSVKDVDLMLLFSKLKYLKKILLHSSFSKTSRNKQMVNQNSVLSHSIRTLYLCNVMTCDVIALIKNCPNLKELHLYDLQITSDMFECMNKSVRVSMKNCYGCPLKQIWYRLQLHRYVAYLKQYDRWNVI